MVTAAEWNKNSVDNVIALSSALLIPAHQSGQYYRSIGIISTDNGSLNGNILYATPYPIPATRTYDRLSISTAGGSGNGRFGIYADSGGVPGALVLDAGASALGGLINLTISQSLTGPEKYWLAAVFSANTGNILRISANILIPNNSSGTMFSAVQRTFTYAALPDPFGTIAGYDLSGPLISLRAV